MNNCRFCGHPGMHEILDLHHQPASNDFLTRKQIDQPEMYYPLKIYVCDKCFLVQVDEYKKATDIFNENYVYYSSQSPSNVSHAKEYVDMMMERFRYDAGSNVVEIGSNDGYLLQHFKHYGIKCLGIDPAEKPASVAIQNGIPTLRERFGVRIAKDMYKADLICSINTIAHQPDINDFVEGMRIALKEYGVITAEFPHLMKTVEGNQFDQFYQEHYNYYSLNTICEIFMRHGLVVFDVEELDTHGGSLRIYAGHKDRCVHVSKSVIDLLKKEKDRGMMTRGYYYGMQCEAEFIRKELMNLLYSIPADNIIMAYGAAAKGNTLLNYCGIREDLVLYVVDRSPHKQNLYLPGSHIRVVEEAEISRWRPDYVLILPWNIKDEIVNQLSYIREWGGKFIVPIPKVEVIK